ETSSGAEVAAVMSEGAIVSASALPCASCHGRDGKGRTEGGVSPSNITWDALTKPSGGTSPGGRSHPAYDERSAKKAIALGIDPAGNALNPTMPRYRMSQTDMADLLAYLKRIGNEPAPGVTASAVRIGTIQQGGNGTATRALLEAAFAEVNDRGGLFGRKLELSTFVLAPGTADRRAAVAGFLDREPLFALVAPALSGGAGSDADLADLLAEREIPAVGALSLRPPGNASFGREVFYQLSSLEDQARALVVSLAGEGASAVRPRYAVVASEGADFAPLADAALAEAERKAFEPQAVFRYPVGQLDAAAVTRKLADAKIGAVIFFGPARDQAALLNSLASLGSKAELPLCLSLGAFAGHELFDLPAKAGAQVRLAFPVRPIDPTSEAAGEWRELAAARHLEARDLASQATALTAAKLLVAALEKSGRQLTRDRLVEALETFQRFESGVSPPLRFGPGRRLGARGAYLVKLDLPGRGFVPEGGWIEVE